MTNLFSGTRQRQGVTGSVLIFDRLPSEMGVGRSPEGDDVDRKPGLSKVCYAERAAA